MKRKPVRLRLDQLLVEHGLADSIPKATAMVLAGEVHVNGKREEKAGARVPLGARVELASRRQKYASRAGMKLEGALKDFSIDPSGCFCLDVGASHGGFTDCLLQRGAARVYAVDVNTGQLDWKLRNDPRVTQVQRNARELKATDVPELVDLVVVDVSFISVCKVIGPACARAKHGASFVVLVKPQFELPRDRTGAGGIVTDKGLHEEAVSMVRRHMEGLELDYLGARASRLTGAEGNQEYFVHARKKTLE